MSLTFDATLKDMARDSPRGFAATFDRPPVGPVKLLNVDLSKEQQSSDWGSHILSAAQKEYAAGDVLYLHELKARLDQMLEREGRHELARACFGFIPARTALDLGGWGEEDIFAH